MLFNVAKWSSRKLQRARGHRAHNVSKWTHSLRIDLSHSNSRNQRGPFDNWWFTSGNTHVFAPQRDYTRLSFLVGAEFDSMEVDVLRYFQFEKNFCWRSKNSISHRSEDKWYLIHTQMILKPFSGFRLYEFKEMLASVLVSSRSPAYCGSEK